ncbi:hypothetical protein [Nostoc sp.]|uniref:hypothetical protein n=1 Tax=Nostoc sp. TaxID=1180 RepID=UPI002FF897E2
MIAKVIFEKEITLAIEGPGWLLQNFQEHWNELDRCDRLLYQFFVKLHKINLSKTWDLSPCSMQPHK